MKFHISRDTLQEALQRVQHVVNARTTLPILSNVLLEVEDGTLRLSTTDLDMSCSGSVEAEVKTTGATTIPARKLVSIVRELPAQEVVLSVDKDHITTIKCGPSNFKIFGIGPGDFPKDTKFEGKKEFTLPQRLVRESLKKTSYAISTDETRYVLNGVFCSFRNQSMVMVATDGRRLAMMTQPLEFPVANEVDFIIPTKAVNELQRTLGEDGDMTLQVSDNQLKFVIGNFTLVTKQIEGTYPNFRQVIPSETKHRVEIDRETLLTTVGRVSLLASDKANNVRLKFSPAEIEVVAQSPDIGEAKETLEVKYDGPTMQMAFNPDFLLAPLRNLNDDVVYIDLIDEMSPGLLKTSENFLYVLMPMRVNT